MAEMAKITDTPIEHDGEQAKVESWRLHVLIEAGYPLALAEQLAASEADLHTASSCVEGLLTGRRGPDPALTSRARRRLTAVKARPTLYGDRKVYPVSVFNSAVARLRRPAARGLGRGRGDRAPPQPGLGVGLPDAQGSPRRAPACRSRSRAAGSTASSHAGGRGSGAREGQPELYEARGSFAFRATTIERFGLGEHLAALERLKASSPRGLFAAERKRPLPRFPRAVGLLTGADAAARATSSLQRRHGSRPRTSSSSRPASRVRAPRPDRRRPASARRASRRSTSSSWPGVAAASRISSRSRRRPWCAPFAACPVPVVSAVGHEQDTPLCDLAADVRAATPTAAVRLVLPDLDELARDARPLASGARDGCAPPGRASPATPRRDAIACAPRRACSSSDARRRSRRRARGCARSRRRRRCSADTRSSARTARVLRDAATVTVGDEVDVELAAGALAARVEEVHP